MNYCQNNRIAAPIINVTPSLGSTTSPYQLQVTINQRLCARVCQQNTPVFIPSFEVTDITNVGGTQYMVQVRVQGTISYTRSGCGCEGAMSQPLNTTFSIPVTSATAPTSVTITKGNTVNDIVATDCQTCSRQFVSDNFITLTVA